MMQLAFSGPFGETVTLFDEQETFISGKVNARFRLALAGRGGGKTFVGVIAIILELEKLKPGQSIVLVAPTFPMLNGVVMPEFEKRYWHKIKSYDKVHRIATDYKGRLIYFRSADNPNKIRGLHPHAMLLDEAGQMKASIWDIANGCVSVRLGKIFITTTPYQTAKWLKTKLFDNRHKPEYLFIRWVSHKNPEFKISEFERLRAETDPRFFKEEYEAEFVSISGLVFPEFSRNIHVSEEAEFSLSLPVDWSMDFGVNMPTFVGFWQRDPSIGENGQVRKFDELWQTDMDFWSIMDTKVIPRYPTMPKLVTCDPTGKHRDKVAAISHATILKEYGRKLGFRLKYKKDWNSAEMRMHGIKEIKKALLDPDGFRIHPRCKHTIDSFENYVFVPNTDEPEKDGIHDHAMEESQYYFIGKPKYNSAGVEHWEPREEVFEGTGYYA